MNRSHSAELVASHPLISDQIETGELKVILAELESAILSQPGAVVEFGCYIGTTSLFIRRLLDSLEDRREFHVYDSFSGLPPKSAQDSSPAGEQFVTGELSSSKKQFLLQFKKANLRSPIIHKAWFSALTDADVPAAISFAFLDGDYYESIHASLARITGALSAGSVVVVDDYASESLPGAARAVDEWLRGRRATMNVVSSLAVIKIKS